MSNKLKTLLGGWPGLVSMVVKWRFWKMTGGYFLRPLLEEAIIFVKIMRFIYSLNFKPKQQQSQGAEDQLVLYEGKA